MRSLIKDFKGKRPLLITPAQAEAFLERVASIDFPVGAKMSDMGEMLAALFGQKQTLEKFPPYAIVPVKGCIGRNLTEIESLCGCCDIQDVEEMIEECERDPSIKTIILDVDSPGGTSVGVPELANRVKNCSKQVISFTASECCSAAYWIASQASSFYATPSSSVGSIGVYIAYNDMSAAFAKEGVTVDVIRATGAKFKGAGIPGTALTLDQRKMLQDEVDEIYSDFKAAVQSVREFVEDSSMEGQVMSGRKAAEAGLVTALCQGWDELMMSLDAKVAAQMEADEENDAREEVSEMSSGEEGEEGEEGDAGMSRMAAGRALKGIAASVLKPETAKKKLEESEDGEDGDGGEEDVTKDPEDEKKDGEAPQPKGEDAAPVEDKRNKSDPDDPDYDPDEDPELKDAKKDAEDESDDGDSAVDTDTAGEKSGTKRNKSRGVK